MNSPNRDPGIEHEPHLRGGGFQADPNDPLDRPTEFTENPAANDDEQVEHTVWDEPALSPQLTGPRPADSLTYAGWLERRIEETGFAISWTIVALAALAAGPWALIGALTGGGQSAFQFTMIAIFGPVIEEIMKVAVALWIVEKRPFYFQSREQILVCVLAAAFVFAAVENMLYLTVYVRDPSAQLVTWRWTICVALHMGCSLVAGLGLVQIWQATIDKHTKPVLADGAPYMVTAMVIHGIYNTFAVLLSFSDYRF